MQTQQAGQPVCLEQGGQLPQLQQGEQLVRVKKGHQPEHRQATDSCHHGPPSQPAAAAFEQRHPATAADPIRPRNPQEPLGAHDCC